MEGTADEEVACVGAATEEASTELTEGDQTQGRLLNFQPVVEVGVQKCSETSAFV